MTSDAPQSDQPERRQEPAQERSGVRMPVAAQWDGPADSDESAALDPVSGIFAAAAAQSLRASAASAAEARAVSAQHAASPESEESSGTDAKPVKRTSTLKAALRVASGTLLSRVLGLSRDIATAFFFGMGVAMDAFFIAFLIPNLFRKLFGEGALSAAVIPAVTEEREQQGQEAAVKLVSSVATALFLFLSVIAAIAVAVMWNLDAASVGMGDPEKWDAFRRFFSVLAPMVVFLCVGGLQAGVLNTAGSFGLPSVMPALHNVIWLGGIVLAVSTDVFGTSKVERLTVVCATILLGTLVQWGIQGVALYRKGYRIRPRFGFAEPAVKRVWQAMAPTVLALAVFQINTLLDLVIAEWFVAGDKAVSAYSYANRLFQFPLGIVSIALGTAIFPMLSRYAARGEVHKVTGGLMNGVRLLGFIVFPAAVGLAVLNESVVFVLLSGGEFTAGDAERTARVLLFFTLALPLVSCMQLVTKAFYAMRDTKTPTRIALMAVAVNLGANLLLVQTPLEEAGLALGSALSALFNLIMLALILRKRMGGSIIESARLEAARAVASDRLAMPLSASGVRATRTSLLRSLAFAGVMGVGVWLLLQAFGPIESRGLREIGLLFGAILCGVVIYATLHLINGSQEIREFKRAA